MKHVFSARLAPRGPNGAWTFLPIPFDAETAFGTKGRVAVSGTLNEVPFRSSLMPQGDGTHAMMVNRDLQSTAHVGAGDTVAVVMQLDVAERNVHIEPELATALVDDPDAKAAFERLAYSRRKEYADWIASAKRPATRSTRVLKAIELLRAGRTLR